MVGDLVREFIAAALIVLSALVIFSAAIGLLRFPDVFTRMHAATTAGVVGSGGMMLGAGLAVGTWGTFMAAAIGIFFLVSTVTLGGHMLGRAAYLSGAPLSDQTVVDALQNVYERRPFDQPQETTGADAIAARPAPSRRE